MVSLGTRVAVVAIARTRLMDAAKVRVAKIRGARIGVLTIEKRSSRAFAIFTRIVSGAHVPIAAGPVTVHVHAPFPRHADVGGAGIDIVTQRGHAGETFSVAAYISYGARIAVVAGKAFMCGDLSTLAGIGIAAHLDANGPSVLWFGANHQGVFRYCATVGYLAGVAKQGAVAHVVIFQFCTVRIGEAVTVNCEAGAFPLVAGIGHRARVFIVAIGVIELSFAPAHAVAQVVSAWITVVAGDGEPHTNSPFAVVCDSARIAIDALAFAEALVGAPRLPGTGINCAVIVVVALVDVFAVHQRWFIYFPVAVVVQPVALFLGRRACIALGKTFLGAYPFALARTRLVGHHAGCEQPFFRRLGSAGADPRFREALGERHAVNRVDLLAGKPPGAVGIIVATSTAEAAFLAIVDACIVRAAVAFAVAADGARLAQVGVV